MQAVLVPAARAASCCSVEVVNGGTGAPEHVMRDRGHPEPGRADAPRGLARRPLPVQPRIADLTPVEPRPPR